MREILDFIRPPEEATWKAVNRWRWNVCLSLGLLMLAAGWAYSPRGFAWGSDVDAKVAAAMKPAVEAQKALAEAQVTQGLKIDSLTAIVKNQMANGVAAQIRLTISKRCKTQGYIERDELNREKDRLQAEYFSYKGERYPEPTCADL